MSAKTIWPIRQLRADFHAGHISKAEAHLADTIADLLVESGKYPHREWQPYACLMARMILLLCRAQNPVGPRSPGSRHEQPDRRAGASRNLPSKDTGRG